MPNASLGTSETLQRRSLRRYRLLALGLLAVVTGVFVATYWVPAPAFWTALVRAGAEAAMVGALADWFAVSALFRHPLGLPIPHTAIIPRNKDRIGEGLGAFVAGNFLEPRVVARKLQSLDLAQEVSRWLTQGDNAQALAERLASALALLIGSIEDREVRAFFAHALQQKLGEVDLAKLIGRLLEVLTERGHHQALFTRALRVSRGVLARNEQLIYQKVEDRSAWWVPKRIDKRIAAAIVAGVADLLEDLARPDHAARLEFDRSVQTLVLKLKASPRYREQVDRFKRELLESELLERYIADVWDAVRRMLVADIESQDSKLRTGLAGGLQAVGRALEKDAHMRARLNARLEKMILGGVVPWRTEIGTFIAEVVRSWDARTVTERLELAVGRDLQFIRINGTVVGALVGCVLFLITWALRV